MELQIEWGRARKLNSDHDLSLLYSTNLEKFPTEAGIYIFGRKWGTGFEALYVGKANNIRSRVMGQFNNLRLMRHIQQAKNGERIIIVGLIKTRPGQQKDKCLKLIERGIIRHFLSEGHDIVNKQGTRLRRHEIVSSGAQPKKSIPSLMYLEKSRGE